MCRAVTMFLLTQRARLGGPFRYLEHVRQANRKFSAQKSGFGGIPGPGGVETYFQRPLEIFLLAWRTCSRYLKGPPNLVLCVSKKNRDRTTHQSDFMSGKVKKSGDFEKMKLKIGLEYSDKTPFFGLKLFFKGL